MPTRYKKPKIWRNLSLGTRVIGDDPVVIERVPQRNKAHENARKRRWSPTPAQAQLDSIFQLLNHGALRGRYIREYAFADRWILDFFWENRLGIEVDGSVHLSSQQQKLDRQKELACEEWDITLLRLKNEEVFGDRGELIEKLRGAWRAATLRYKRSVYSRIPLPVPKSEPIFLAHHPQ